MFFRQIITTSGNSFKAAGHMVPSGDDPDVEVESYDYESSTAYPANTVVWYNGSAYISVTDVPVTAGTPDTEPSLWAWFVVNL